MVHCGVKRLRTAVEGDGPVRLLGHAPSQPPAERARTAAILQRVAEGKTGRTGEGTFGRFPMILVDVGVCVRFPSVFL